MVFLCPDPPLPVFLYIVFRSPTHFCTVRGCNQKIVRYERLIMQLCYPYLYDGTMNDVRLRYIVHCSPQTVHVFRETV